MDNNIRELDVLVMPAINPNGTAILPIENLKQSFPIPIILEDTQSPIGFVEYESLYLKDGAIYGKSTLNKKGYEWVNTELGVDKIADKSFEVISIKSVWVKNEN